MSRFARGGRDTRAPGIGEFRDNRARPRAGASPGSGIADSHLRNLRDAGRLHVALRARRAGRPHTQEESSGTTGRGGAPSSTMPVRTPAVPGRSVGRDSGHAHASRIAPSGFRERPRAEAPTAGAAAWADGPGGHPDRLLIKARSKPLRERTMVRPRRPGTVAGGDPGPGEARHGRKAGGD